jgi:uncharacterized lipoprotein YajG
MSRALFTLLAIALLAGCAAPQPPKPWEKGNLARPEMTMAGDALDQRFTQHVYQSKENGTGSSGVGGGGCGCN